MSNIDFHLNSCSTNPITEGFYGGKSANLKYVWNRNGRSKLNIENDDDVLLVSDVCHSVDKSKGLLTSNYTMVKGTGMGYIPTGYTIMDGKKTIAKCTIGINHVQTPQEFADTYQEMGF